jgi:hypothetical protein
LIYSGATALSTSAFSIMTVGLMTLSIMAVSKRTLSIMPFGIMTLKITAVNITKNKMRH